MDSDGFYNDKSNKSLLLLFTDLQCLSINKLFYKNVNIDKH